jgi:FKBP-type peptidyl-prolyl cis-trans isomerase
MAATPLRKRIFALVLAILFFVFSGSLSFFVIWDLYKGNKEAKTVNDPNISTSNSQVKVGEDGQGTQTPQLKGTQLGNFTPVAEVDSLQITDLVEGDGETVQPGAHVLVDYTGAVAVTGTIFESSFDKGQPVDFGLDGVIQGWTDGIPGMKVGGTRRLLIPADQAYGANPRQGSGIPPNAALVFDVTLKDIY